VWALLIFRWSLSGIDQLTINIWGSSPNIDLLAIPFALALYHSAYNLVNTFLLLGFSPFIAVLSEKIFIPKSASDEEFQLKFISTGFSLSEFSLLEVQKELPNFVKFCKKMFDLVPLLLLEKNKDNYDSLLNLIKTYEDKSDDIDKEIADYLKKVSLGELSEKGAKKLNSMLRISKEIESISDCSYHMANRINMKNDQNAWFAQELRNNLKKMFDMLNVTFDQTLENLQGDYDHVSIEKAQLLELQINKLRNELLNDHLTKANDNEYSYQSSLAYFDLVSTCEKIGDHLFNINEAVVGLK
jgi:phosphate:Na+ symporter